MFQMAITALFDIGYTAVQSVAFPFNSDVFMAFLAEPGLNALERFMALAAVVGNVSVGDDVGNRCAAVVQRREVTRAKSTAPSEIDANRQTHPQDEGGDESNRRKDGMLAFQPSVLSHLNKPARK